MRVHSLVLATLALLHSLVLARPMPIEAATFDAEVTASQEAASGSSNSSDADEQTTTTSPAAASLTFSGSSSAFGLPQRTGTTHASGSATTQFDQDGLEMGVVATSTVSGFTDGLGPFDYRSTTTASANFLDAITLTGGTAGETGYIRAVFTIDGTLTSTPFTVPTLSSRAELFLLISDATGGFQLLDRSSINGSTANIPSEVQYYLKYKFDQEAPFAVAMSGTAFAFLGTSAQNVRQTANFGSTLRFVEAEVLDKDFQPVCGGQIVSSSGLAYPHGPLDHIVVTPDGASIAAGTSQTFVVEGFDSNCNSLGNLASQATLTISPNGSCTGATCTATVAGPHTVTAVVEGKTDSAALTVTPGPLHHLTLSPSSATITAGGNQAYTAQGFDAFNNSLGDLTGATTFSLSPNGSCVGASCSATVAGAHTVTGTSSGKTGTAALTVNPGPLDHLVLSPASVSFVGPGSQAYTAQGFDAFNNSLGDVTGATTFSIAPDGSCVGATCSASALGAHTVTGNDGSATGTATLTIVQADLAVIAVGNPPVTINRFGKIAVSDTVKNQGTAQVKRSLTRYYLSLDLTKNGGDKLLLGFRLVGALAPGQSSSGGASLFVFGVPAGTYNLLACADDTGMRAESDEGNNCLASSTPVIVQ